MKRFRFIVALVTFAISSCNRSSDVARTGETSLDRHEETLSKFQDGQKRFKELIATIRDEKTFDAARPELTKIAADWREVATALSVLEPPAEDARARFREMISEGHRRTEPTAEDMLGLLSIESRETETSAWFEEFVAAGGKAGSEMQRLYGTTDYATEAAEVPQIDLSNATIDERFTDQLLEDSTHTPKE